MKKVFAAISIAFVLGACSQKQDDLETMNLSQLSAYAADLEKEIQNLGDVPESVKEYVRKRNTLQYQDKTMLKDLIRLERVYINKAKGTNKTSMK